MEGCERCKQIKILMYSGETLKIDRLDQKVWVGEKQITLTHTEYRLLAYFVTRIGKVLTREELLQEVWDARHGVTSNSVDVYINYLRQKLGHDSITTVRTHGYALDTPKTANPRRDKVEAVCN